MTREEAIIYFKRRIEMFLTDNAQEAENWAIRVLEDTVEGTPKGSWVEFRKGQFRCSECQGERNNPKIGLIREVYDHKFPYCPNCGAKMGETIKEKYFKDLAIKQTDMNAK